MKSNFKIHSAWLYRFLLIALCLLPMVASAQIILETKGDDTPIRVFGKETIKVFGGMKHNQIDNNDPKKSKLLFNSIGSQLILTDTLYNASGNPIFLKTNDGQDSSKVIFQSLTNNKNYILGDSINFYQMAVDLADYDHEVILGEHIFLRDTLTMQLGNINLNGQELFLIPEESDDFSLLNQRQPYIQNEYYESYIWDTLSGAINLEICVPQNEINSASYNFGGMGIELQNTNNSLNGDVVQFKRKHNLFAIDTFESLRRQYHIDNVDDTDIFNQTFNYMNHELTSANFDNIQNLILYRSRNNGISWDPLFRDTFGENPINNYNPFVHKDELDSLAGIWSLSPCPNPPSIATLPDTTIVICALDTIWLNAGPNVSVLWSDGSTQNPYPFVAPEIYDNEIDYYDDLFVEITDDRGCYNEWYGLVEIHYSPLADLIISSQYTDCEDPIELVTITAEMDELFDYDYLWHDGSSNQTFQYPLSPVGDSTYWVTATYIGSQLTCSSTDSIDVSVYPSAAVDLPDSLALSCDGSSIILDAGTYVPGATYEWFESDEPSIPIFGADSSVYEVPPFIGENNFVVTVSFDGFCFSFADQDVTMTNIQLNANHTDIDCFGDNNGLITTNISGSYPDHIAYFNGADTDGIETFPDLSPGTYILEVEDSYCSLIDSIEITEPIAPITGTLTPTDIACASLGQIDFAPAGGTPPYTFLWTNGETTEDLTNLTQGGDYTVTLTDANACTFVQTTTVNNFGALTTDLEINEISCFGETDGSLEIVISTGTPPFSYNWNNSETTEFIDNLGIGAYSVTITDANNCTSVQNYNLLNPAEITADYQQQNILCAGETNGSLTAQNLGGTGPFTFAWNTGDTSQDLDNLPAGVYNVTITDSNNCTGTGSFSITEPSVLIGSISSSDIDCNNPGQLNLTPSGGNTPYTFLWSNGATTEDQNVGMAGVYNVTITDTNGCNSSASAEIFNNGNLSVSENDVQNISCNGELDGAFTATATGGVAPYIYDIGMGPVNTPTFTGLAAGTYNITITDANACIGNLEITLDEPLEIEINITSMDAGCGQSNGSAMATATGGTGTLSYLWPDASTDPNISNLAADSYIVTVTDATGCTNTATASIGNSNGPVLDPNPTITNVNCNGENTGAITVAASGGTGTLTYTWSNSDNGTSISNLSAGDYVVTVADANNCQDISTITISQADAITINTIVTNIDCSTPFGTASTNPTGGTGSYSYLWSTGSTDMNIVDLTAGFYTVTVTDANNCSNTETVEITSNGTGISVSNTSTPIDCNGAMTASISLTVNTGGSYIVNWNTGQIGETINNLPAGNYIATITSGPCMEVVEIMIDEPTAVDIVSTVNNISCSGTDNGSIDLTISGGTGAYTFVWDNGETTEDLSNLAVGDYMVTVMDANNCSETASFTIGSSSDLNVNVTGMDLSCFELNDGTATANVFGGLAPFTYSWNNGGSTETISDLPIGSYEVTVTDASGCEGISSVTLTQPAIINFSFSFIELNCFGDTDGAITVSSNGGPQPVHQYNWSTGQVGATISNLTGGVYTVTITSGSCSQPELITLNEPDQIFAEYSATDVDCFGGDDGTIDLTVFGGVAPLTYNWDNGATTEDLNDLTAAFYNLTITDSDGCTGEQMTVVDEPDMLTITESRQLAGCKVENDGWISLDVTGGVADYLFVWSNGSSTPVINNLSGGNYSVTVSDQNDCTIEANYELDESPEPFEAYFLAATPVNYGDTIQFVDVSFPKPNSWNWSFDDQNNSVATEANPEFFYPQDINNEISYYDVALIASTDFCTDTIVKEITVHNFRNDIPEVDTTIVDGKYFEYFNVYPNPTNGLVMLDMKLKQTGDVKLYLTDSSGKRIRKYKLEASNEYFQHFDLGQLAGGVYVLTAKYKKDRRSVKLIVVDER